ncbi:MAG: hypothetical protein ABSG93_14410 [Solirubrobacteraceae bacterium]
MQMMDTTNIGAAITIESPAISIAMKTTAQRKKNGNLKRLWGSGSMARFYAQLGEARSASTQPATHSAERSWPVSGPYSGGGVQGCPAPRAS